MELHKLISIYIQAIALSLQHSAEVPGSTLNEKKGKAHTKEDAGRGKRKKSVCLGFQIYFFHHEEMLCIL